MLLAVQNMDMGEGEAGARCLSLLAGAGADLGKRSGVRGMCALGLASVLGHAEAAQRLEQRARSSEAAMQQMALHADLPS